ncbi:MAG: hypothetical protein IT261_08880 [Saprospiraceae bacterium]|nr:hypothetical protein [Saprospiraceae bacterium]
MSIPSAIFPNETYLNGLRSADPAVIEAMYHEFRPAVVKSVETMGGNYADGAAFFKVALLQTAEIIEAGNYHEEIPVEQFICNLAMRHFQDWRFEKIQEFPAMPPSAEGERVVRDQLPEESALRAFRGTVRAKREFNRLEYTDQKAVLDFATQQKEGKEVLPSVAFNNYLRLLGIPNAETVTELPPNALKALTDTHFHEIWTAAEGIELRLKSAQIPKEGENKTIKYAFITLMVLTLGYVLVSWLLRDQSPEEVYNENFNPPPSIIADIEKRYANDSIPPQWAPSCMEMFAQADDFYKKKEWRSAATVLAAMLEESSSDCQTDIYFYLAIVGLYLDRPELTLQCISKLDDLDRFGEDIYWYMALAYVKMAVLDPSEKDMARRALERAMSNTEIPERRIQAEKMLEDLSD